MKISLKKLSKYPKRGKGKISNKYFTPRRIAEVYKKFPYGEKKQIIFYLIKKTGKCRTTVFKYVRKYSKRDSFRK